jgi:predicted RNase H-like HicB family nuclease
VRLNVELEREDDGRWIAEVVDLPGVLAYGHDPDAALRAAQALAFRVIADRIEHGELDAPANRVELISPHRDIPAC